MALNVNRGVTDQFYRYKMPGLVAKVEGKGNGIKTVIVNMPEIAKALYRPPMYPTKYFGCELGAQIQYDNKNERYIVNGSHDARKLQELLDGFIKKFVLCEKCANPETNLKVHVKRQVVTTTCTACGHQGQLEARHRLTTFIIKNPPEDNAGTAGASKPARKTKSGHSPDQGGDDGSAANGRGASSEEDAADHESADDDDWAEDMSEAAVAARACQLTSAARTMAMSSDAEKSTSERINMIHALVSEMKASLKEGEKLDFRKIESEACRLEVRDKAVMVVAEVLLDENIVKQVNQHRPVFLKLCYENPKAQKYLLGALEVLIGDAHKDKLLARTSVILKAFYDLDILDEEVLLEWGGKVSKKYVSKETSREIHEHADKFITWLKEADEESSEEDEDTVDFSITGRVGALVIENKKEPPNPVTSNGTPATVSTQEDDDDVDIDDI